MLPPPLSALEERLGYEPGLLQGTEKARAEHALEDAAVLALAEAPAAVAARWATDAPAVVRLVVLKAARREFENPREITSENLGEHTVAVGASSGVYLTAREVAQIRRAATGRSGGFVGSVRTPPG